MAHFSSVATCFHKISFIKLLSLCQPNKTQSLVANLEILVAIWQIYFFFFETMVVHPSASTVLPRGCCSGSSTSMSLELCSTGCRAKLFEFVDGPTFSVSSSSNSSCSFPTLEKKEFYNKKPHFLPVQEPIQ